MQSFPMKQARSMQMCSHIGDSQWCHRMLLAAKKKQVIFCGSITPRDEQERGWRINYGRIVFKVTGCNFQLGMKLSSIPTDALYGSTEVTVHAVITLLVSGVVFESRWCYMKSPFCLEKCELLVVGKPLYSWSHSNHELNHPRSCIRECKTILLSCEMPLLSRGGASTNLKTLKLQPVALS